MNTIVIIQARMGSTRLPGKVMKALRGKSVLERVVERVQKVGGIDGIIVATTTKIEDDIIQEECTKMGIKVFRGDENDVLSRYYGAALDTKANTIIRITSDCPLIDKAIITDLLDFYNNHDYSYVSNTVTRSFPRGLDAEVFSFDALELAFKEARNPEQREHVTPFIYQNPKLFKLYDFCSDVDYSQYRWTLDTEEDWLLITKIIDSFICDPSEITWKMILQLMIDYPELTKINEHVEQKKLTSEER